MFPKILHLYGNFAIHTYGVCIAFGLALFTFLLTHDPQRKKLLSAEHCYSLILIGIVGALCGGRLLYVFTTQNMISSLLDVFYIWQGGFSILGALVGCVACLAIRIQQYNLPLLALLDLGATYAPILQAFGRIGCFFAGCCYGAPSSSLFAISYTNPDCMAPLNIYLYPTQLFSAFCLLIIFMILRYLRSIRTITLPTGIIFFLYIALASFERFILDFFRGDNQPFHLLHITFFSINQCIALALFLISLYFIAFRAYTNKYEFI